MNEKKSKAKQILSVVLIVVLIFGGCVAAVGIYVKSAITEGTVDFPTEAKASLTSEPNKDGFADYINKMLLNASDSSRVKTNVTTELSIDPDSVTMNASAADIGTLKFILQAVTDNFTQLYPSHDGDFGDGFDKLPEFLTTGKDITDFSVKRGVPDPEDDETATEENFNYFEVWFKGTSPYADNGIANTFTTSSADSVIKKIEADFSEMFELESHSVTVESCMTEGKIQRLNDQLDYIELVCDFNIKLNVIFKNAYSALDEKEIFFSYRTATKYSFTWAGVEIAEGTITLSPNEEETLPLSVILSDNATDGDYKISFESSDSSVVSVDKDGNIKSVSLSSSPVTVTVDFEYLGNSYRAECEVYSINQVKKVKTYPEEITLKTGESQKLSVTITPDDATIKDVLWFTEDEETAAVDDFGNVTAKKAGTVKVYAVTVDGHFRSSCTVTVTGGESNAD